MTFGQIIEKMQEWAGAAQAAIAAGQDLKPFVEIAIETWTSGEITDEKLAKLQAFNDAQSAELQKPLEDEPGA